MLNKQQINNALVKFGIEHQIPQSNILIFAGSAMVMRGLRNVCSDIDMGLPKEDVVRLQSLEGFVTKTSRFVGFLRVEKDVYDVGDNVYPFEMLNGYKVQTLESLLEMKIQMNREKDQADIIALKNALSIN